MLPYKHYCISVVVFLFTILRIVSVSAKLDAIVQLTVEGNGFHRNLWYQVDIQNFTSKNCYVALYIELPSLLYVNMDELADLRRQGINVCANGTSDVELFAEQAGSQNATACAPLIQGTCVLRLPIHQRYQHARECGNYTNVSLPKPKLFIGCRHRIQDHRVSKADLCSPCIELIPKWREVPYDGAKVEYVWTVPIGDLSHLLLVTYVTLAITIIASIFIIRAIWKSKSKSRIKIQ